MRLRLTRRSLLSAGILGYHTHPQAAAILPAAELVRGFLGHNRFSFSSSTRGGTAAAADGPKKDDSESPRPENEASDRAAVSPSSSTSSSSSSLFPERRRWWKLMESSDGAGAKKRVSIPVLSTVGDGAAAAASIPADSEESPRKEKPLSLWPGMYHSPVTAALWAARSTIIERALNAPQDGPPQVNLVTRTPSHSRTSILYAFSEDKILQEQYRNPWSGVRMGKLLEDLDALAGTIAVKHCADEDQTTRPLLLVTASVDKISLFKPLLVTEDLTIAGAVAWVGRSSMEIRMEVVQPTEEKQHSAEEDCVALRANFTFVARDSTTKKSAPVNRLQAETEAEKALYQEGEGRDARRKSKLRESANEGPKSAAAAARVVQFDARFQALMSEGRVLRELPTLADRNTILISDTRLENAMVCQPQQRNMHGRIFGGFLMRRAYELAYSTCYVFCGTKPVFLDVDHVDFRRPVDVGDLLRFNSCVLYTETKGPDILMHLEVIAYVTQPELRSSEVSNTFYFTFTLDESLTRDGTPPIFKVLPGSEEEARTVLARYDADHMATYPLLEKQNSVRK